MMRRPCVDCGTLSEHTRCAEHTVVHRAENRAPETKAPTRQRGYGTPWRKLSEKARRMQPFCIDCGTRDDLTADHSEQAWRRHNAGKPVRLADVEVCCRACNARRGRARPSASPSAPGGTPSTRGVSTRGGEGKCGSQMTIIPTKEAS